MLWNASEINGYAIEASDGSLGTVDDMLFEDLGWAVRWLVVDTGRWLPGRKVLLPLSALGQPDREERRFPVTLTMQQVKDSPDIDTDQPVSRQHELDVYRFYGWDPYWDNGIVGLSNAIAQPVAPPLLQPEETAERSRAIRDPASRGGDPHLRSIAEVTGYHIHAVDGEIGHAEDFLVEDGNWNMRYIKVDTRNWWPGKRVLLSPRSVREIDWADRMIYVNADRQKVKASPPYDPSVTIDDAYQEELQIYYGWEL